MCNISRDKEIHEDLVTPELICYISIDIVGSTAYKTKCMNEKTPFVKMFSDFFNEILAILENEIREFRNTLKPESDNFYTQFNETYKSKDYDFKIDKLIGDEILLKSSITSFYSIPIILISLQKSIKEYRKILYKTNKSLDLKATVWLSQCPLINNKIAVELFDYKTKNKITIIDCLGPSMDIGFRLSKFSTKDYITISVEVAYILGDIAKACNEIYFRNHEEKIKIMHRKPEPLKGVFNGIPYPIIQISCLTEIEEKRQAMTKENDISKNNLQDYTAYFEAFINTVNNDRLICKPFIVRRKGNTLYEEKDKGKIPEGHKEYLGSNEHYKFIIVPFIE